MRRSIFTTKDSKKSYIFLELWATRLRTIKFGQIMILKSIKTKAHNENQCKISICTNKKWKYKFKKVLKLKF